MTVNIAVQDRDRINKGPLDEFLQLDMVLRFNDVSTWSLELPYSEIGASLIEPGARIFIEGYGPRPITGPMRMRERVLDDDGLKLVVSGFTDDVFLYDRLVYPSAPQPSSLYAFSDNGYDVRTGVAETVMKQYVTANVTNDVSAWDPARALSGLEVALTMSRGLSVTGRGRLQSLLELLQSLAINGGRLGFSVNDLRFDVYEPQDLTEEAVFSTEIGNVASFSDTMIAPEATHFVVAGGGQLEERTFQLGGDDVAAAKWNRRIEALRDRRDTVNGTELAQQLSEEIADKAERNEVTLRPTDTPSLTFGEHYFLGDQITVEGISSIMTQVEITLNGEGQTITPGVSSATSVAAAGLMRAFDSLRSLRKRIANLERNE